MKERKGPIRDAIRTKYGIEKKRQTDRRGRGMEITKERMRKGRIRR